MFFLSKSKIQLYSYLILIYSLFLTPYSSSAASLEDSINIAQANNRNIKLEKIKLDSTKTLKTQAMAEFLPNVSASVQYGQRNSSYNGQTYDPSTKQKIEEIKLEQPIFDGLHSVSKYREANYKIKSAHSKTSDKIQEISFAAVSSHCNLYRYQELAKLQKESKELGEKFLKLVQRRKDVKLIDRSEIIKFKYEVSVTEEKYLDSLNKLNRAKFDYKNVVGELPESLIKPEINEEEFDRNKVLEAAISDNHNIKSYQYSYLASKAAYNAEKSNFLPKVSITASSSKQDKVVYLNNQDLNTKSVFLNVSVPIFQKGVEYANMNKARYDKDAAMEEYEISKDNVTKEVNQTLEEYRFFLEMNKSNKKLFELAKDRDEIFSKRLKSKVEDPIESIRTKIETNERKINYINSQMDLVITHYKIKYFLGEI